MANLVKTPPSLSTTASALVNCALKQNQLGLFVLNSVTVCNASTLFIFPLRFTTAACTVGLEFDKIHRSLCYRAVHPFTARTLNSTLEFCSVLSGMELRFIAYSPILRALTGAKNLSARGAEKKTVGVKCCAGHKQPQSVYSFQRERYYCTLRGHNLHKR